jgi:hypothetical protein
MIEVLGLPAVIIGLLMFVNGIVSMRRRFGSRQLLRRYQARAHRSVVLSQLFPEPWADRPYGFFLPKDVGA